MKVPTIISVFALMVFSMLLVEPVVAQAVTASEQVLVPIAPWYESLSSVVITLVSVAATALLTVLANLLNKYLNVRISEQSKATLHSALVTGLTWAIEKFGDQFDDKSIDVRHPVVKDAIEWVRTKGAPSAIRQFDLTEEDLEKLVLSKLKLLRTAQPSHLIEGELLTAGEAPQE